MTIHTPRYYQLDLEAGVFSAWNNGHRYVLAVLPTGGGKSFVVARVVSAVKGAVCVIAHRAELVSQLSLALAREGVTHRVIGPDSLRRACTQAHLAEFQRAYYDPNARVAVASVDTLVQAKTSPWFAQVQLWVQDEAHHVLRDNKWGKAAALFPNAYGLGVTATPTRADGKGLGDHADGLFTHMVVGPTMRELIRQGFLTDYRVFVPPSDIDLSQVTVTESGDYSPPKLKDARRRSTITGDVVGHYARLAPGKLGVTFDTDVESAGETADAFRCAGVPAEMVSAKTPDAVRRDVLRRFRAREVLQLVNVDLFGEGFDLPGIEVVQMARPTQSYSLYAQQFGRALRPLEGKLNAIIIDHVGNVKRHGLPDARSVWTLDRRDRRSRAAPNDVVPVRNCLNPECLSAFERYLVSCPYCGTVPPVTDRSAPDRVDGDLLELDPSALAKLRGEIDRIEASPVYPNNVPWHGRAVLRRRHEERQAALLELQDTVATWAGWQRHLGRSDSEAYRRFYLTYGTDVMSAQTLGPDDSRALRERVQADLVRSNVMKG